MVVLLKVVMMMMMMVVGDKDTDGSVVVIVASSLSLSLSPLTQFLRLRFLPVANLLLNDRGILKIADFGELEKEEPFNLKPMFVTWSSTICIVF